MVNLAVWMVAGFQRVTDGESGCVEFGVDFRGRHISRVGREAADGGHELLLWC